MWHPEMLHDIEPENDVNDEDLFGRLSPFVYTVACAGKRNRTSL